RLGESIVFARDPWTAGTLPATLLEGGQYEIVHLTGPLSALPAESLPDALRRTGARLVVLHGAGNTPGATLDLADAILRTGIPAVVAAQFAGDDSQARDFYYSLYDSIIHDVPLDLAVDHARRTPLPALFLGFEAEDVLRISPLAKQTVERAVHAKRRVQALGETLERTTLGARSAPEPGSLMRDAGERHLALESASKMLESGQRRAAIDRWDHESGGIVPLAEAMREVEAAESLIARERERVTDLAELAELDSRRVVNTFFRDGNGPVAPDRPLHAGATYAFALQIGPRRAESNVRAPVAIPEDALAPFYDGGGVALDVVLFSDDFDVSDGMASLVLPRSGASPEVNIRVTAPKRRGAARLRAGVYYRRNLLQSLLITVAIVNEGSASEPSLGNSAEVEYALSGTLQDIERFAPRTVNVLTNEKPDGSHTFAVLGTKLRRQINKSPVEIASAGRQLRDRLLRVAAVVDAAGQPQSYRFDDNNRGTEARFVDAMKELSRVGWKLCTSLIVEQGDPELLDELRAALGHSAVIQIAATKSARYVLPWAMVYDKPLIEDDGNEVCPEFLAALKAGGPPGFLAQQTCLTKGCPHADDTNVICPSGFWGFKHIVEQPTSALAGAAVAATGAAPEGTGAPSGDVVFEIFARGHPSLVMAMNQSLVSWEVHAKAVTARSAPTFTKKELGKALAAPGLHLLYFYCHGRHEEDETWLGIGTASKEDKLKSGDLVAFQVRWPSHPLVFINGCQTVDLTPDDLVPFLETFSFMEAAGVVGTEIAVPEPLAQEFALGFLAPFLGGEVRVGPLTRQMRLALLEKYNPLGLGYTPYCSADLQLHVRAAPTLDVLMLEARRSPQATTSDTEAPALDKLWTAAGLAHRIVSNDLRFAGAASIRKRDYVDALRGEWSGVLHLAVHGDATALALEWSTEPDVAKRTVTQRLSAREIGALDLAGAIVVSGACSSGMGTLVEAFRRAGARAYVAPVQDVAWARLVPFFERFYGELAAGRTVGESLTAASSTVPDVGVHYADQIGDGTATLVRV
ncbi:MAG: CHAT domain-containing protein, partial [Gemmatimonadaceae bacterium]